MKTIAALLATLFSLAAFAGENNDSDRAAALLAGTGRIAVNKAGPYVQVGSFEGQVVVKLGRPSFRQGDTWFYENYHVTDSEAHGVLIVRFADKRVSSLALVTSSVATAMQRHPSASEDIRVAHSH